MVTGFMITAGVFGMLTGIVLSIFASKIEKINFHDNIVFVLTSILLAVVIAIMITYFVLGATI